MVKGKGQTSGGFTPIWLVEISAVPGDPMGIVLGIDPENRLVKMGLALMKMN